MEKQSLKQQLGFALFLLCSLFMAGAGLLGFAGWWSDPSNQKWWALLCGLIGVAGTVLVWTSKDEMLAAQAASIRSEDEEIKRQPVAQQLNYWRKERRNTLIGAACIFTLIAGVWLLWKASHDYNYLFIYVGLSSAWTALKRLIQSSREIGKLARE